MSVTDHQHNHEDHRETCRHLLASLSDYVDGVLDEALCAEIEAHMATCENCQIVVNTLAKTVELYQESSTADLPSDVRQRLFTSLNLDDFRHA